MLNKKNSSYKTTLLLDLGETVFIALSEKEFQAHGSSYKDIRKLANIHSSQALSEGGASTDSEATDFYEQVLKEMAVVRTEHGLSPASSVYHYP